MRRGVPLGITFITGTLIVVAFFIPHQPLGGLQDRFLVWYAIVLGFTMVLGTYSLVRIHAAKVARKKEGWGYSLVLLFGLGVTVFVGVQSIITHGSIVAIGSSFMWLYTNAIVPLQATMFALLSFFIASAAYRAFKARSIDATLLLLAAGLVMLGRVPVGQALTRGLHHSIQLPVIADWLMEIPQMAAKRGILIGTYLGAVAMSLRIILGIERTYLA